MAVGLGGLLVIGLFIYTFCAYQQRTVARTETDEMSTMIVTYGWGISCAPPTITKVEDIGLYSFSFNVRLSSSHVIVDCMRVNNFIAIASRWGFLGFLSSPKPR